MEYSKRDRLISLIMPLVSVLYGVWVLLGHAYHPVFQFVTGLSAIGGGVITGVVMMLCRINIVPILKVPTIAAVVTFWLHFVSSSGIIISLAGNFIAAFYVIFFIVIDLGSVVLMMIKLPEETQRRQKLAVFFANPVLYSLINTLMKEFANYLSKLHLLS